MRIRRFRQSDTEGIIRLVRKSMREYGESFGRELDRDLLDIPKYYGNRGAFWVALDGDKIVGTIAVSRITDEVCKFRRFYVDSRYRGKGLGSRLFEVRSRFAKKMGYLEAWSVTSVNHKEVISFLKRRGAVRTRRKLFPTKRAHMFFIFKLNDK